MNEPDKKALQILFDTYWDSGGWKRRRIDPETGEWQKPYTPPEDLDYALRAGIMFMPKTYDHDDVMNWLLEVVPKVALIDVSNAFLSSLSTRRLDWRSALGSYAVMRHFPSHPFRSSGRPALFCECCGLVRDKKEYDFNALNFGRFKWGGVMHVQPEYAAFDLELFIIGDKPIPTRKDFDILEDILRSIRKLPAQSKPVDSEKAIAHCLPSTKDERRLLLEILGYCGILQASDKPGYMDDFVSFVSREIPSTPWKNDWQYPLAWWKGSDGINQRAMGYYFPQVCR